MEVRRDRKRGREPRASLNQVAASDEAHDTLIKRFQRGCFVRREGNPWVSVLKILKPLWTGYLLANESKWVPPSRSDGPSGHREREVHVVLR